MNLIRFNQHPANFLSELMEDLDKNFFTRQQENRGMMPSVNIRETEESFMLDMAAPGLKKEDFKINLDNNVLTISSELKTESEEKNERFVRKEFYFNAFSRSFTLPKTVDLEKIKADYTDGILSIALPKREDAKIAINREIAIS
ncbi:MAG: Hsp20/alpha crystallin family protein [Bacteroidales bacterium]|jgi:HSP20 family protein|nr:Hsp20/alpha crystallin family protein [Bacteroidales bacterium]MDP2235073.1 Hsp20/alpha crystallin family protein [Bacteroidales bacterium]